MSRKASSRSPLCGGLRWRRPGLCLPSRLGARERRGCLEGRVVRIGGAGMTCRRSSCWLAFKLNGACPSRMSCPAEILLSVGTGLFPASAGSEQSISHAQLVFLREVHQMWLGALLWGQLITCVSCRLVRQKEGNLNVLFLIPKSIRLRVLSAR